MSIVGRALGRLAPLLAGFLASVAVSMALASGITALDIDGAPSVVLAVALWCTAIGTAAKLLYAR